MKRRDILKYTALITGAAVSAPLAGTILSGCQSPNGSSAGSGDLHFFSREEMNLAAEIADIILPSTESPSATAVGVHTMIDRMVGLVYKFEDKESYRSGFNALARFCLESDNVPSAVAALESGGGNHEEGLDYAYKTFKQQTIAYYLSTEEIGENFLNYLPVPGEYKPCITLDEVENKAWAI